MQKKIESIDHCHPNLLVYKLLTNNDNNYETGIDRSQTERDIILKEDHDSEQRGYKNMMIKMKDLLAIFNDLERNYIWSRP